MGLPRSSTSHRTSVPAGVTPRFPHDLGGQATDQQRPTQAPDDGAILTEHNRGAWELAHLISMRLGHLPGASAGVTA